MAFIMEKKNQRKLYFKTHLDKYRLLSTRIHVFFVKQILAPLRVLAGHAATAQQKTLQLEGAVEPGTS